MCPAGTQKSPAKKTKRLIALSLSRIPAQWLLELENGGVQKWIILFPAVFQEMGKEGTLIAVL